jgi:hypothetical protein
MTAPLCLSTTLPWSVVLMVKRPRPWTSAYSSPGNSDGRQSSLNSPDGFGPSLVTLCPPQRRAPVPRAPELSAVLSDRESAPRRCCTFPPMWRRPSTSRSPARLAIYGQSSGRHQVVLDGPAIGHSRHGLGLPNQRISRARLSSSALSSCFVMFLILCCAYQTIRETRVCFMGHQTSASIIKPQSAPKSEAIAHLPATKPTCRCEAFCGPTPRPTERDARRSRVGIGDLGAGLAARQ